MRSKVSWPGVFVAGALALVGLARGASPSESPAPAYGVSVTVSPGKVEGGLRFLARVSDAATRKPLAGSDLTVRSGETAKGECEDPASKTQVLFVISLSQDRGKATYALSIRHRGKPAGEMLGEMQLPLR